MKNNNYFIDNDKKSIYVLRDCNCFLTLELYENGVNLYEMDWKLMDLFILSIQVLKKIIHMSKKNIKTLLVLTI